MNGRLAPASPCEQLNPAWVELLQGFPIGWTELKPLETPLCPRSPSTSDGG